MYRHSCKIFLSHVPPSTRYTWISPCSTSYALLLMDIINIINIINIEIWQLYSAQATCYTCRGHKSCWKFFVSKHWSFGSCLVCLVSMHTKSVVTVGLSQSETKKIWQTLKSLDILHLTVVKCILLRSPSDAYCIGPSKQNPTIRTVAGC